MTLDETHITKQKNTYSKKGGPSLMVYKALV